jgi:UDP-N-acetylmuramate--alanine ligase
MNLNDIKQVFFIGIGGIGMSALARFFKLKGVLVAGYDKTPSSITETLQNEGIQIVFSEEEVLIDAKFKHHETTLVVYTPAVSVTHRQLTYFKNNGFCIMKRSEVLGLITQSYKAICIAGTHGKTTISTLTAHLFKQSEYGCNAFLGGISKNYNTNFLFDEKSEYAIVEADEFDRSFLKLKPYAALISSVDADHLDIYENIENMLEAYQTFGEMARPDNTLVLKYGLPLKFIPNEEACDFTYSITAKKSDFFADNIRYKDNKYFFDLYNPVENIFNLEMNLPGLVNVENAVAASSMALIHGVEEGELRTGLQTFKGIERRFDVHINTKKLIYIDDYAHHPEEIRATLNSVRKMYPKHKLQVIFQPHLFTRTRDFYKEFAEALNIADRLILTDIYPAREEPIEGVTSKIIGNLVTKIPVDYCNKSEVADILNVKRKQVIITMGAGNIDREVPKIKEKLLKHVKS